MEGYIKKLQKEAQKNKQIFWDISKNNINSLSPDALVERFLNYGNMQQFQKISKDKASFKKIYFKIKNKDRNNLSPIVINYVDLYLKKNE
jgi:hypothetical protein